MASRPTTRPETWVPAGAERGGPGGPPTAEGPAARRPSVPRPPASSREPTPPRASAVRRQLTGLRWAALGIALPWAWYLVRDLGPAMQLVAFALPVIVGAALLGLVVAAFDGKRVTTVLVAISVGVFGWVTITGPRGAQPSPAPRDPVRVATIATGSATVDPKALAAAVTRSRADVVLVATPSKPLRASVAGVRGFDAHLVRAPFVILSRFPLTELALPKGLDEANAIRIEVGRPGGAFVLYGATSGTSPLDATLRTPTRPDRLGEAIAQERLPVVLLGDLGITDRSLGYRDLLERLRDAMRAGASARSTLVSPVWTPLLLRVDHVLTSAAWCARGGGGFEVPGAEHVGLAVAVGPCPGGDA